MDNRFSEYVLEYDKWKFFIDLDWLYSSFTIGFEYVLVHVLYIRLKMYLLCFIFTLKRNFSSKFLRVFPLL